MLNPRESGINAHEWRVCTLSLVFAAAGVLRGRPATTHWGSLTRLAELDPTIEVRDHDRFVDSGDIVTAARISSAIDMALHLVARLHSTGRAVEVRRGIQYDPNPPSGRRPSRSPP
jgi:transcriptional regulator GlxA family with amidase domain